MQKNINNKHDYKANIRKGRLFYETKPDLRIIYFILFYKQTFRNCSEFTKDLKIKNISRKKIRNII